MLEGNGDAASGQFLVDQAALHHGHAQAGHHGLHQHGHLLKVGTGSGLRLGQAGGGQPEPPVLGIVAVEEQGAAEQIGRLAQWLAAAQLLGVADGHDFASHDVLRHDARRPLALAGAQPGIHARVRKVFLPAVGRQTQGNMGIKSLPVGQAGDQPFGGQGGRDGDAQPGGGLGRTLRHGGGFQGLQGGLDQFQIVTARGGQLIATGQPYQQALAQMGLQSCHGPAHRALSDAEQVGCLGEAAQPRRGGKGVQLVQGG